MGDFTDNNWNSVGFAMVEERVMEWLVDRVRKNEYRLGFTFTPNCYEIFVKVKGRWR